MMGLKVSDTYALQFVLFIYRKGATDGYEKHFGNNPTILTESSREAVDSRSWKFTNEKFGSLGSAKISTIESSEATTSLLPSPDVSLLMLPGALC